ncbi:MAG TPA: hypothetical protein VFM24_04405 [Nitrospira sp.]|nr:hypothetical protein [Nitrospira sp.]
MHKRGIVGYSKKSALLEEAVTHMNTGKYGRSSAALKELLALDPQNTEARRLFATLHLKLGSLVTARQAFESLANEAIGRQDYWLAESLLREYLAAGPRCVPFLEQLAQVYQEKGDEMAAVVELGKAIEILRDDPDPDNPQKPAQLYSKIRELAPASSVALQLASLFDVQTGELLVRPPAPPPAPSDDPAPVNVAAPAVDHPLPEVMPWEMAEELPPETAREVPETSSLPAPEEPHTVEPARDAASFSYHSSEPLPAERASDPASDNPMPQITTGELSPVEPASDSGMPEVTTGEPLHETTHGTSAPMPWEQVADASVQIPEPEPLPPTDGPSTLESVLASLRTEGGDEALSSTNENPPSSEPDVTAHVAQPAVFEAVQPASAALSAPMPWEHISDPAIEIPAAESSPTAQPQELQLEAAATPPPATDAPAPSPGVAPFTQAAQEETLTPAVKAVASSEATGESGTEEASSSAFSWNSVFDKAWKFTAATMAPSATVPSEAGPQSSHEFEPAQPEAAASSVAEPPTVSPPTAQEILPPLPAPEAPAPSSTSIEEQLREEGVSVPPAETRPAPADASSKSEVSAHWSTGEVAVQVHRPSKKKKRWQKEPDETAASPEPSSDDESSPEPEQEAKRQWKSTTDEPAAAVEPAPPPVDPRPEWMRATEAITFAGPERPASQARWSDADVGVPSVADTVSLTAASAVDVLFSPSPAADDLHSHRSLSWSKPRPRLMARLHRVRIGVSSFIGSCFSTTRSLTFLVFLIAIATAVVSGGAVVAVAVMWMAMEEQPSSLYQTLTISPPRLMTDVKKNGYLLLLGFDAPEGQDPVQTGYERKADLPKDRVAAQICIGEDTKAPAGGGGASDHAVKGWIRSGDLLSSIKGQSGTIKSLMARESTAITRYQQWLSMPFDDWGFGQSFSPNCNHVLFAHRLFLLDGFSSDMNTGLDRLEADIQAWRAALGQSKTLPMKMLAVTAVQDDALVAGALLSREDLDGAALARLSKMVRPLDQVELSIRWPMQSQFVWATRSVAAELRDDQTSDRPWPASMAAAMRLPVQRRANAYAEYYDAANKTVAGGRYMALPKLTAFVQTPPAGLVDYLTNPVEHIVGIEPLPSWDPYVMRMVEADAQLRLAGLQAWLRRGPQDTDVLVRLAKAGHAYYDPFTGLPMLVNLRKGVIYSVGRDGKDQEGDNAHDVAALLPLSTSDFRRSAALVR